MQSLRLVISTFCVPNINSSSRLLLSSIRSSMLFRNYFSKMPSDKEVEESIAQALFELKNTRRKLKSELKGLHIKSANQIDVSGAVVILYPLRFREPFRKIRAKLVRELGKKWSGKDVVFVAAKRIVTPQKSSDLFDDDVHRAMLEDLVHPAKIVRMRWRPLDITIYLDPKTCNDLEYKLKTFRLVYQKLWPGGRSVYFKYHNMKKIHKIKYTLTDIEKSVAQALFDLEDTHEELKNDLKGLYIKSALEVRVSENRTAVVIMVPCGLVERFRMIHTKLVRELEKILTVKDVVIVATRKKACADPRALLEDIVYPAEVVAIDGEQTFFLDPKDLNDAEYKLETFHKVCMVFIDEGQLFFEYFEFLEF